MIFIQASPGCTGESMRDLFSRVNHFHWETEVYWTDNCWIYWSWNSAPVQQRASQSQCYFKKKSRIYCDDGLCWVTGA